MHGRLIVLEGAEGVGKSTQLRRLDAWLCAAGIAHCVVREPGGTPLGDAIRALLLDPAGDVEAGAEALLFLASRAQLVSRVVRPALARGEIVLADRYMLSSVVYQVAGRGLPEHEVLAANALATGGLAPALTLVLTVPAAERARRATVRGERDRMEGAGQAFHERVSASFAAALDPAWQRAHPACGPIVGVAGEGTEEDVFARVHAALAARWPETFASLAGSEQRGA